MNFTHNDMLGKQIVVGDIVVFTEPGAGRNLPSLRFGEVMDFTKATVKVFYLDKNHRRERVEERVEDRSVPPYWTDSQGQPHYRLVGTGVYIDRDPVAVKIYDDRFLIVGHI